jgi:hypothetical protein
MTYPIPYVSLADAFANSAKVYNNQYNSYFSPGFISDGITSYTIDGSGNLSSQSYCYSTVGYSSFRYASGPLGGSGCQVCDTARGGVFTTGYFGATVINVGTTLYTDNALTSPISSYLISDGVYSYTLDGFGVVLILFMKITIVPIPQLHSTFGHQNYMVIIQV